MQQGCQRLSSMQSDNTAWEGHHIDDLILSWGQPDRTEQLGADYVAYTWVSGGANCVHTFTVSNERINGYSSSDCND
ncbi:MAG: hypothetical protein CL797_04665 [Chromatiales bacterium]|nr:hypothetical protein [Chromatiales bacterium]